MSSKDRKLSINSNAALDNGPGEIDNEFILGSKLTLPPSFGSAYTGEAFSCALCANNELPADAERRVTNVKIEAEMQTRNGSTPLDLMCPEENPAADRQIQSGESLQRIVRFNLLEVGDHTLAVNLSYFESSKSSGKVRTFRKLYQFVVRPCLNVKTKISTVASDPESLVLEAQLNNLADEPIVLKKVTFNPKPAYQSTSLNWDMLQAKRQDVDNPILSPQDITQVAFLINDKDNSPDKESTKDSRLILGSLSIEWRTAMGGSGFLTTGWLTNKKR